MTYDTLLDRQVCPPYKHLSAHTLDKVSSILSEDFAAWLSAHPLIQGQIGRWMASMNDLGWMPISRVYTDYVNATQYDTLADYLADRERECLTVARWVKSCSKADWAGIDGVYDQFVNWVAAQEIKQ